MKNIEAINKIIGELAMKDYLAYNPIGKYKKHHPYTLSPECMETRAIRDSYLKDEINEEEYKAWCLRYNLTH